MAIGWIVGLAPKGVIEWVPKEDPTVGIMLAARKDFFEGYRIENFERILERHAVINEKVKISESGRILYSYKRRND